MSRDNSGMDEREYGKLRKSLIDEFRKNLEALDRVWGLSNGTPPPVCGGDELAIAASTSRQRSKGEIAALVLVAIENLPDKFSTRDVEAAIKEATDQPPERSSISHTLKRMEKDGRLAIVVAGKGKRSTVYRKSASVLTAPVLGEQPKLCTDKQRERVIELANTLGISPGDFRRRFMDPKGRPRLAEMESDDVEEMIREAEASIPERV
jgi:hypothetical protein